MKNNTIFKAKLRQSIWLLVACLCVVFSGAVKKVIKLHSDAKISHVFHTENDGSHLYYQSIKDGPREKHEVQEIGNPGKKQSSFPGFDPSSLSAITSCRHSINLITRGFSGTDKNLSPVIIASCTVPPYILFHKMLI